MPKSTLTHASERIDKTDLDNFLTYANNSVDLGRRVYVLDHQSRIVRGFRIEIADQGTYPGRLTIHGGEAYDFDGKTLYNEDQADVSRTITLEGAGLTFYVEVEFTDSDSDSDARAFWDPTIDQGLDVSGDALPDSQELSTNIATRRTPDWRIVQPVSQTGFQRDTPGTINSTRIPIFTVTTDGSNNITGLTTEKAVTVMLQQLSATEIRVQNPQLFRAGQTITVSQYSGSAESATISAVDHAQNLLTISTINFTGNHQPGAVVRVTSVSAPNFVAETAYGRYRRDQSGAPTTYDYRDKLFQGDEIHGKVLSQAFTGLFDRSDLNLQSIKDYIDFIALQLYEMKWGHPDPYTSMTDSARAPVGLGPYTSFNAEPRYYDRSDGLMASRGPMITVGDGSNSYGDFNGTDHTPINAALGVLPTAGGTIFIKKGTYTITSNVNITSSGKVIIIGEPGTNITCNGGNVLVNMAGSLVMQDIELEGTATSTTVLQVDTTAPAGLILDRVTFTDGRFGVDVVLPDLCMFRDCTFSASSAWMQTVSLVFCLSTAAEFNGTFQNCNFNNAASTVSNAVGCFSLTGAATSTTTSNLKFNNCQFFATNVNATTGALVHLSDGASNVFVEKCEFNCTSSKFHINCSGGSHIKISECSQVDAVATFVTFTGVTDSFFDNNRNGNSSDPAIVCNNCSRMNITNNKLRTASSTQLTNSAIQINATAAIQNVNITGNHIEGDTTNQATTGIILDINGSFTFNGLSIHDNTFHHLEAGIYFNNSSGIGIYRNVSIQKNNFHDEGTVVQKISIVVATTPWTLRWSISNNIFENLTAASGTLLTRGRVGVLFSNSVVSDINVVNNLLSNVGVAAIEAYGIDFATETNNCIICNNRLHDFEGDTVVGIRLSANNLTANHVNVNNNNLELFDASTTLAGILADGIADSTFVGNVLATMDMSTNASTGLIFIDGTSTSAEDLTIADNVLKFTGSSGSIDGIYIRGKTAANNINITGNTIEGVREGVKFSSASSPWNRINISNNFIFAELREAFGINMANTTSSGGSRGVIVQGNTINVSGVLSSPAGIRINDTTQVSIANNFVEFYNGGANTRGITLFQSTMYSIHGNILYRGTGNAGTHIKSDDTSALAFAILHNILEEQNTASTATTIDTNNAANPHIVGLNFKRTAAVDDVDAAGLGVNTTAGSGFTHSF